MADQNRDGGGQTSSVRSLRAAIRKAKLSQADRADVIVDLREAEQARLELLFDELQPVFDEMPDNFEQFECALVPGDPPRLWIDMLVYVVMGPDKRSYRMVKDLRDGRRVLQETQDVAEIADYVTDYLAHRIVERERALESDAETVVGQKLQKPGYSGAAIFLSLLCGFLLGVLALFVLGAIVSSL